ncbi:MAG: hypothetical protein ACE5E5_15535 [Phycisphaerae bacterium]
MARSSDPKKLSVWQGRFRRFLDSGLAVARFCAIEHVSESSFYYWQKKLGPQAVRRPTRAEDRDTRAQDRDARAEDRNVFQPVTVVPAGFGVLVRLPGGTQIEVGTEHLDAIRAVVAETVRVDRGGAVYDGEAHRRSSSTCRADHEHGSAASC